MERDPPNQDDEEDDPPAAEREVDRSRMSPRGAA